MNRFFAYAAMLAFTLSSSPVKADNGFGDDYFANQGHPGFEDPISADELASVLAIEPAAGESADEPFVNRVPKGAEDFTFLLVGIKLEGMTLYKTQDIESVYADKLDTEISVADLYGIANELSQKYFDDGHVNAKVTLKPQEFSDGKPTLSVDEGTLIADTAHGMSETTETAAPPKDNHATFEVKDDIVAEEGYNFE